MRLCETALLENLIKSSTSCLVCFRQREPLNGDDSKLGIWRVTEHKIRLSFSAQFTWQRTLHGAVCTFHFVAMQVDRRRRDGSGTEFVAYRCQNGTACKSPPFSEPPRCEEPCSVSAIRDRARRRIVDHYEMHNVCLPQEP